MAYQKVGVLEWLINGVESYPAKGPFNLFTAAINLADTDNRVVLDSATFLKPSVSSGTLEVIPVTNPLLIGFKFFDLFLQLITGTLIFGFIQALAERLRAFCSKQLDNQEIGWAAWIAYNIGSVVAVIFALTARVGLFVTQILAGALRFPCILLSGFLGLCYGLWKGNVRETVADFVWPFAPKFATFLVATPTVLLASSEDKRANMQDVYIQKALNIRQNLYATSFIYLLSLAIAITLVVLLATGTFGIGAVAAMPVLNTMVSGISFVLNSMLGFLGFHAAGAGAAFGFAGAAQTGLTGLPILSGLATFLGIGAKGIAAKVFIGTVLVGALTTFFNQVLGTIKDNTLPFAQKKWMDEAKGRDKLQPDVYPGSEDNGTNRRELDAQTKANLKQGSLLVGYDSKTSSKDNTQDSSKNSSTHSSRSSSPKIGDPP